MTDLGLHFNYKINNQRPDPISRFLGYPYRPGAMIDRGRKLENAVFLHHRRQREDLGYVAGPGEIDLVVGLQPTEAWINTAWSLADDDTWSREIAGLSSAGGPARRVLVARETAGRTAPAGIELREAWRHLLAPPVPT